MENDKFIDFCATLGKLQGLLLNDDLKEDLINVAGFTNEEVKQLVGDMGVYQNILLRKTLKSIREEYFKGKL